MKLSQLDSESRGLHVPRLISWSICCWCSACHSYHANLGKRLVKAPKVYVRDSGLLHALLNIEHLSSGRPSGDRGQWGKDSCWKICWRYCRGERKIAVYRVAVGETISVLGTIGRRTMRAETKSACLARSLNGKHHANRSPCC